MSPHTRSRSRLIVVLLVATLGMTGLLGYEAHQAVRSHRASAEGVLRDYAGFAAWELSRQGQQHLLDRMNHGMDAVRTAYRRGDLALARGTVGCSSRCTNGLDVRDAFHVRLSDRLASWSRTPAPEVASLVERIIDDNLRNPDDFTCPTFVITTIDDEPLAIVLQPTLDRASRASEVIGVVTTATFVAETFAKILRHDALLPPSLVQPGTNPNTLLTVRVESPADQTLFASSSAWSAYAAQAPLARAYGSLKVAVAITPEAASTLVIGGLPRDRLPLIIGLMALTTGLVIVSLVQLRREAEIGRMRSNFVSGVSHELRTPLAQIRMFTETLLLGRVRSETEGRRSLEIVAREAQRLSQLVENVLLFSRGERQRPEIHREATRLASLVGEVVESFAPLAASRHALIRTELDPTVSARVDEGALRQVLLNLLDNAVKYGPAGQVVRVGLCHDEGCARLTVEDEGPGVDPRDASRIWRPFHRLARPGTATGGAGIGLAIVKQLVELHDGHARVEAGDSGARFIVEFPGAWRETGAPAAVA